MLLRLRNFLVYENPEKAIVGSSWIYLRLMLQNKIFSRLRRVQDISNICPQDNFKTSSLHPNVYRFI